MDVEYYCVYCIVWFRKFVIGIVKIVLIKYNMMIVLKGVYCNYFIVF